MLSPEDFVNESGISELRHITRKQIYKYSEQLKLKNKRILDAGIGGDKIKPSDNSVFFGEGNIFKTLDVDSQWNPDYTSDISSTSFPDNYWGLVIVSQTLEHIYDYKSALIEIQRITRKYAIIDIPFEYQYHATEDAKDYWRMSPDAFEELLGEVGFSKVKVNFPHKILTSALCVK